MLQDAIELIESRGWKRVSPNGWKAPVSLCGTAHYFTGEAAYEMETKGDIYQYSAKAFLGELLHQEDVDRENRLVEEQYQHFLRTGEHLGSGVYW